MSLELTRTYSKSSNRPTSVVINFLQPYKTSCYYVSTQQKSATYSKETFFCLDFLTRCIVTKIITDGEKLTTAEIQQKLKKLESSHAMAKHINSGGNDNNED